MRVGSGEHQHIGIRHEYFRDAQRFVRGQNGYGKFKIVFERSLHRLDLADDGGSGTHGRSLGRSGCGRRRGHFGRSCDGIDHALFRRIDRFGDERFADAADGHESMLASASFLGRAAGAAHVTLVPVSEIESHAALSTLLSRASTKALTDPGPDDAQLRTIFEVAVRAPDHGALRPWRFFVVRHDARKRLADLFEASLLRRDPQTNQTQVEKEREKALRAPLTIAIVARTVAGHKIPEGEQVLSTAAAAMNVLNAVHALGFGAKWITPGNCYDAEFRRDFGLAAADQLLGFIQVGTAGVSVAPQRPDPAQFVTEWNRD